VRALRKRATRDALLDAGVAEFAAHGLDAPSLDAICARAGYTRGAFYVHFRDREEFLLGVGERVLGRFVDAVIAGGDQPHDLERTVGRFVRALSPMAGRPRRRSDGGALAGMQVHRLLEACTRSPEIRARVVGLVQAALGRLTQVTAAAQAARTVRDDVDARQAAAVLLSAAIGVLTAIEMGLPLDLQSLRKSMLRLLTPSRPARRRR
jgi:AcrR family transcriptional regulator